MLQLWQHSYRGVMSGIIGADNRFGRDFNQPDASMQGNIVALYDIGCVVGSILAYFIGEKLGRRMMLISGGTIMIIGTAILASSTTIAQLIVGRIVTGIGNGMNSSTAAVYQSECSPALHRGALLTLEGVVTILGLCIAYWLDYGTSFTDSPLQWRFPLAFQAVFAVCLVIQVIGLPESPRWLVQQDRHEEARGVIAALRDLPELDPQVEIAFLDIQLAVSEESAGGPFRYQELFTGGEIGNFRRILLTIGIQLMQQFTGANMINYYAPIVYQKTMGISRNLSLILGGCTSLTYLVGSIIPVFLIDRLGRRSLLMISSMGLAGCFCIAAGLLSSGNLTAAYAGVAFIFIFQLFLGVGWLPVPWFYPAEINTTRLRSRAAAISSGWNWMSVFAVVKFTPIAIESIGWRTFIIFAVLNTIWIPIIYCFYPETKGLELEDIDLIFAQGGITGGVWSNRGYTVKYNQHAEAAGLAHPEKQVFSHQE
ncbi:hypothetical protein G7Z17_g640 [Cylindrodendrum hubeiense]|uniref:Major facilitator superfamily (MFS) profile domain-containing protein n=1 Tax=Cylindrodendrum hubeiense TaxID=595255 RepID=A0A9P5LMU0_9HYPO|nr:hypothetical protein G7Z17_g640 [Cylindrodendrum hubeiense]